MAREDKAKQLILNDEIEDLVCWLDELIDDISQQHVSMKALESNYTAT